MILLQPDCLVFKTASGENIPCSAQQVTVELIGPSASSLDEGLVQNAAQAVLHYFKSEVGKTLVSVGEFAQVLERVLRGLGFDVHGTDPDEIPGMGMSGGKLLPVAESDLGRFAETLGKVLELDFFPRLREELRRHLDGAPGLIRFRGLRACVKTLTGSRRWSHRCQALEDQIVDYLRACLSSETEGTSLSCPLVIL